MYQTITLYEKYPWNDTLLECFDQGNEPIKVKNLFKFYEKMEGFDNKDTMLIN